jgi:HSP20 family protein
MTVVERHEMATSMGRFPMFPNPTKSNNLYELAVEADSRFNRLNHQLDRLVSRPGNGGPLSWGLAWSSAPMGLWEDDEAVYIELDAPGVKDSDIEVEVHQNRLNVRVERKAPEGRSFAFNNRAFGKFERSVGLPPNLDSEAVHARLADGVLSIRLNKRAEAKPRRVAIETT